MQEAKAISTEVVQKTGQQSQPWFIRSGRWPCLRFTMQDSIGARIAQFRDKEALLSTSDAFTSKTS